MKFNLPRRQRKSFESVSGKSLDSNLNKKEALEIFENVKKSYSSAPNSFGSKTGKKEEERVVINKTGQCKEKELLIKQCRLLCISLQMAAIKTDWKE